MAALIFLAVAAAGSAQNPVVQRSETVHFKVGDADRTALVFWPSQKTEKTPVVFVFHGHGGGSRQVSLQFRIHLTWPEAAVVYPQGIPGWKGKTDTEGVRSGWQGAPGQLEDRDLKFTDEMLKWTKKEFGSDASRTFVMGHSNGSLFTWVLQAERGSSFAGFAGLCAPGSLWYREAPVKPAFVIAGVNDELVGIRGMRIFANAVVARSGVGSPTTREDGIKSYSGKATVWVWEYEGGHAPPANAGAKCVEFFKGLGARG